MFSFVLFLSVLCSLLRVLSLFCYVFFHLSTLFCCTLSLFLSLYSVFIFFHLSSLFCSLSLLLALGIECNVLIKTSALIKA